MFYHSNFYYWRGGLALINFNLRVLAKYKYHLNSFPHNHYLIGYGHGHQSNFLYKVRIHEEVMDKFYH